jgi:hypothetical protein
MSLEKRLVVFMQEIRAEAAKNPEFAKRLARALDSVPSEPRAKRPHRRAPAAIDPFDLYRQGDDALRKALDKLDLEQLKDVVAEHGMDSMRLALKWKSKDRLIELIATTIAERSRRGDAFREGVQDSGEN